MTADCPKLSTQTFFVNWSNQIVKKFHFIDKLALGDHKIALDATTWGETGRYPLISYSINLITKYLERVKL